MFLFLPETHRSNYGKEHFLGGGNRVPLLYLFYNLF